MKTLTLALILIVFAINITAQSDSHKQKISADIRKVMDDQAAA